MDVEKILKKLILTLFLNGTISQNEMIRLLDVKDDLELLEMLKGWRNDEK